MEAIKGTVKRGNGARAKITAPTPPCQHVLTGLRLMADARNLAGMARFKIDTTNALGVSVPKLRVFARQLGKSHVLAAELWASGIHEARILAGLIDAPDQVTKQQMEAWAKGFNSWDVCDSVCGNLFDRTPHAYGMAAKWASRREEFVKRAGFVLMASLAVHDKKQTDETFLPFLPLIMREADDKRNFVKKAVNWALRQIGKRSEFLRLKAVETANLIRLGSAPSAKWIASDALRELRAPRSRRNSVVY